MANGPSTVVVALDAGSEGAALGDRLEKSGFAAHQNPNALWAFRGEGVVVCLYRSGKCVIQGAGARAFAERHLPADSSATLEALDEDLVGTDESGKGDYFGPLVAAAVLIPAGQEKVLETLGVRDCKQLSDRASKEAARALRSGYPHEVVVIGPERYNDLYAQFGNLNRLLAWATVQAVEKVLEERPCGNVLSDRFGNPALLEREFDRRGIRVNLTQRVRAEVNPAVAAASVLARDAFLSALDRLGRVAGTPLPKGAGPPVLPVARRIYQDGGRDALGKVAKLHFKTTKQVTGDLF